MASLGALVSFCFSAVISGLAPRKEAHLIPDDRRGSDKILAIEGIFAPKMHTNNNASDIRESSVLEYG
jgi:hypothetical protein